MTERMIDSGTSGERRRRAGSATPGTGTRLPAPGNTRSGTARSSTTRARGAPRTPAARTGSGSPGPRPPRAPPSSCGPRGSAATARGLLRRVPFTATIVIGTLVVAVVARTVWSPIWRETWFAEVAYGTPALREGKIWTLLTGWWFYLTPGQYLSGVDDVRAHRRCLRDPARYPGRRDRRRSPARSAAIRWRRCSSGRCRRRRGRGRTGSWRCATSASPRARSPCSP